MTKSDVFYVTTWALTKGILKVSGTRDGGMISFKLPPANYINYANPGFWHYTLEEAEEVAGRIRDARIRSMENSLKKAKALVGFKVVDLAGDTTAGRVPDPGETADSTDAPPADLPPKDGGAPA